MRIPTGARLQVKPVLPPLILPAGDQPAASPTLAPLGQRWPAIQSTDFQLLWNGLLGSVQTSNVNTFSQPQTVAVTAPGSGVGAVNLTLTDTGGGADADTLRPCILALEHDTTQTTVAGVGTSIEHYVKDGAGTRVRIGKQIAEITTTTPGAVTGTLAWSTTCVGGVEAEVFRIQGAVGPAPVSDPNNSTAAGKVGGRVLVRGDLRILTSDAVNNAPIRVAQYEHNLVSGTVAAGFGTEQYWQTKDDLGNTVPMARHQVLVTTPASGLLATTQAWSISMAGTETEVFRIQALGMIPQALGGITGFTGGRMLVQGSLRHMGTELGFFGIGPVARQTGGALTAGGSYTSNEQTMLSRVFTAMQAYGLLT